MAGRKILLIVGGGIAAYKACELIRLCRKAGIGVRCVLTVLLSSLIQETSDTRRTGACLPLARPAVTSMMLTS